MKKKILAVVLGLILCIGMTGCIYEGSKIMMIIQNSFR